MQRNSALADAALGHLLKDICLEGWSSDSARAQGASSALRFLAEVNSDPEITALRDWTSGLEQLIRGQMESAIQYLDLAQKGFLTLNKPQLAAATQVSKLIALAMLGRYDEAIDCGLSARAVFQSERDILSIGKIEHNIGNIYFRRDQYREAEKFQRSARDHFLETKDQIQIAKIENSLALTLAQQHKIESAELLYQQALKKAEQVGLLTTQAEIESSIGTLALYQGYYTRALDFLERSRRKYAALNRPHILAMTEQEIADAYLELNLAFEAIQIYESVVARFSDLGMHAEEARALAYEGRAEIMLGNFDNARLLLAKSRNLFDMEGNSVGAALVELTEAQLCYAQGHYAQARVAAKHASAVLSYAGNSRRTMFGQWLDGEASRADGSIDEAQKTLRSTLATTRSSEQLDISARCLTSLGLLASEIGETREAEQNFLAAVEITERLRDPLPAEEFRSAFFSDKLVPYHELMRLCLTDANDRTVEAFRYLERARSRALLDSLGGVLNVVNQPRDTYEAELIKRLEELRHQLSYFYNQINQPSKASLPRSKDQISELHDEVRQRENKIAELMRQLQHRAGHALRGGDDLDFKKLQDSLGRRRALVEFTSIDDELMAFVITDEGIEVCRQLGSERQVTEQVRSFRFQIDSLRHGAGAIRKHLPALTERARKHLQGLYQSVLFPLRRLIGDRDLVIAPQGNLHYLPFHALHDGDHYLIETRAVSYAPSAAVLQHCVEHSRRPINRALLVGVADERTPRISDEINALESLFSETSTLLNSDATLQSLQQQAPEASLLHLACHAQFRSDNPQFSSLHLGDGWLTVSDVYKLKLNCELVTLSACDTGVNAVAPGEELIGLARGFLSAGSPSVLLSLWTVDDEATAELMSKFYGDLGNSGSVSESLRAAQIQMLTEKPHPFFWSPWVLVGRW